MFIIKNNYYLYIENTKNVNFNYLKNCKKISIIYRNNSIPENRPKSISTPPIVGVPIFFTICSVGPSSRFGSKILWAEKNLINGFPINKTTAIEVNIAKPVLTVRYLKTFKNVY